MKERKVKKVTVCKLSVWESKERVIAFSVDANKTEEIEKVCLQYELETEKEFGKKS